MAEIRITLFRWRNLRSNDSMFLYSYLKNRTVVLYYILDRLKSIVCNTFDPAGTKLELQKLGKELAVLLKEYAPSAVSASDGTVLPGSGFYAADNGEFTLREVMATNAAAGTVKVTLRCLASGKSVSGSFNVAK